MKYEIQTRFINDWENVWRCNDELEYFDSFESALSALDEFLDEMAQAHFNGEIEDLYDRNDYRIVKLEGVTA
jgi:hypothetical protein